MTDAPSESRDDQLDVLLAELLEQRSANKSFDIKNWIAKHVEFRVELETYIRDEGLFQRVFDDTAMALPVTGRNYGPYREIRTLSLGHNALVIEAEHTGSCDRVALKILPPYLFPNPTDRERFCREIEAVRRLDHPHIVGLLDASIDGETPFFAMPMVSGADLATILRDLQAGGEARIVRLQRSTQEFAQLGWNSPADRSSHARAVAMIGIQAALALSHAHGRGLLHRDIKPSNLLLESGGNVLLADFGLAHAQEDTNLTRTGDLAGTLRYMPPERFRGWVDHRSDLYSLGLTLYELLTLQPAFAQVDRASLIHAITQGKLRTPRHHDRNISRGLEKIVLKSISLEPGDRYASANELVDDLERFLEGLPILARPPHVGRRVLNWTRRNKPEAAVIVMAFASLIGLLHHERQRREAAETAEAESRFQSHLLRIQGMRHAEHQDGWSENVWSEVLNASLLRKDDRLRDQAAASLMGVDAVQLHSQEGQGVTDVAFSNDGETLLVGGAVSTGITQGGAKLCDAIGRVVLKTTERVGPGPVGFGADGSALHLTTQRTTGAILWDITNQKERAQFHADDGQTVLLSAMTRDASRIALATSAPGKPDQITIFDSETNRPTRTVEASATAIKFSPDGKKLAIGDQTGTIRVYSVDDMMPPQEFPSQGNRILSLAFAPDLRRNGIDPPGLLLAVGDAGGSIVILDVTNRVMRMQCLGSLYDVRALVFSPDGMTLASAGRNHTVLWDAATGRPILRIGWGDLASGLAFSHDGRRLVIGCSDEKGQGSVAVYSLKFDRGIRNLMGLNAPVASVVFSPDGRRVAVASHDWRIGVWELNPDRLLAVFEGPRGLFADNHGLAFGPDGTTLAACSGTEAHLYDLTTGRRTGQWRDLPPGLVDRISIPSHDQLILLRFESVDEVRPPYDVDSQPHPRVIRVRNLEAPNRLRQIFKIEGFQRLNDAAISPDGRLAIIHAIEQGPDNARQTLRVVGLQTGNEWQPPRPIRNQLRNGRVSIDPTGRVFAFSEHVKQESLQLIDMHTGTSIRTELGSTGNLGPNGNVQVFVRGAAGMTDGRTEIFVEQAGESLPVVRLSVDGEASTSVPVFSSTNLLAWGRNDGSVVICDLEKVRERLDKIGLGWKP